SLRRQPLRLLPSPRAFRLVPANPEQDLYNPVLRSHVSWSYFRSTNGDFIDPNGRQPDADRHRLPFLSARTDSFVKLQIMSHHGDLGQDVRAAADQGGALHRPGDLPVFDEI